MKNIPLSVPNLDMEIVKNLNECIETGWVSTGGRFIADFEKNLANYLKVNEVVGVQSGTAALHLVYKYLGLENDVEVIVPTVTFIATVNPLVYLGANPIFMDCDETLNIDLDKVEEFCENECDFIDGKLINRATQKHVKGFVVVHIFGNPVDMERVMQISEKYNLIVVEDAAESLGTYFTEGKYKGRYTGTIGHAGIVSFNANKIITTGGGGAIISHNQELLEKVRFWSVQSKTDPLYFIHDELGFNYRLLNISAALGVSQLERLESFIDTKKDNYNTYNKEFKNLNGIEMLPFNEGCRPNYWFYSIIVDTEKYGMSRDELLVKLNEKGIQTRPIWGLMHEQKFLSKYQSYKIEKALFYRDNLLNIPCSSNLLKSELMNVVEAISNK